MDAFSYLSVLLSIIVGLGLTQLLTAAGRLIRHRDRVRADWLPLLWAAVLLVVYVQSWWAMFGLREVHAWTFVMFLAVLAQAIALYMMAAVILPEQIGDDESAVVDLRAYYERHHQWFFGFFLATLVASLVKDLVITGHLPDVVNVAFHFLLGAMCIVAILVRRRRVQATLGIAGAAAIAAYIALLFARLH